VPVPSPTTVSAPELHAAIERLALAILARHGDDPQLLLVGIANGGLELARRLAARLNLPSGTLDISFHRDDIGRHPIPKEFHPTRLPADITNAHVVLIDDVLFTGRTLKAALDELFDHGRPETVELAILIDRGGRRLPFAADYCALTLPAAPDEKVVVHLDPKKPANDYATLCPSK
jgi:pyrimidine operon attenuation protein/uracil phosphoribosyltransferase